MIIPKGSGLLCFCVVPLPLKVGHRLDLRSQESTRCFPPFGERPKPRIRLIATSWARVIGHRQHLGKEPARAQPSWIASGCNDSAPPRQVRAGQGSPAAKSSRFRRARLALRRARSLASDSSASFDG